MKKNTKLILAIVALVALIGIFLGVYFATRPQPEDGVKNITIEIVYADGSVKTLTYETEAQYLSEILLEKELVTGYTSEEFGFTIESVDGIMLDWAKDGAYWALYEGDTYASTSAAGIVLTDGGVYRLVYETF